jgi:hypothetical protein
MEPAAAKKVDARETVMFVPFWLVTGTKVPFACTVAFAAKPLPEILIELGTLEEVLTATLDGLTERMVGTVAAITSSVGVVLLPPGPGLLTDICPDPKLCRSAAVSETWSVVPLTKVVGRAAPLYNTTEFASNPLPLTVMVAGTPWGVLPGESPVTAGVGLIIEKLDGSELPPPGEGFESTSFATCPAASADAGTATCRLVPLT